MGINRFLSRKPVIFVLLVVFIVLIVYVVNSLVDNQRYNLYCHQLAWGMNKDQVESLLTNMGSLYWREFPIEGTEITKVELAFKNQLLDYRYGGTMILYFNNNNYYSAALPAAIGEEKGLCKKPE